MTSQNGTGLSLNHLTPMLGRLFSDQEREQIVIESLAWVSIVGEEEQRVYAVSQTLIRAELPNEIKAWVLILATGGGLILLTIITVTLTQVKQLVGNKLSSEFTKPGILPNMCYEY